MAKYKIVSSGYLDQETGMHIPNAPGNRNYQEVQQWIADGNTPDPEFTPEQVIENNKRDQIAQVNDQFNVTLELPATCTVGITAYDMDAKYDSAMRFKAAIDMAQIVGESTIQMVDFHNRVHTVSLDDALEIVKQQAIAYRTAYMTRALARQTILDS